MKVEFIVNNYQLGGTVKMTPIHKIIKQERINKLHTLIQYDDVSEKELQFISRVLSKRAKVL